MDTDDVHLDAQEQKVLEGILSDLKKGELDSSQRLVDIYRETPVSIDEFLESDTYLGKVLNQGRMIYPYWREVLRTIDQSEAPEIILTGAIGTGKSFIAQIYEVYSMYSRVLCLRDPFDFYSIARGRKILFLFFSLTESLANVSGFTTMQAMMVASPWFNKVGRVTRHDPPRIKLDHMGVAFSVGSPFKRGYGITGLDIFGGMLDEISELTDPDDIMKSKALSVYEATARRMESRFMQLGSIPGKLFLVSSKQGRHAFLEEYVERVKDSSRALVFDIPLWEVKPKQFYSGAKFKLAVSTTGAEHRITEDKEDEDSLRRQGYELHEIPVEHRHAFEINPEQALADIAGISTKESRTRKLIPNYGRVLNCIDEQKKSPFKVKEVSLGLDDDDRLEYYFDVPKPIPLKTTPRFVHIDVGINNDCLGIAMGHVSGTKDVERITPEGTVELAEGDLIDIDFAIRVRNKERSEIPLFKIREFLLFLIRLGYRFGMVTLDSYQSRDFQQLLWRSQIPSETLSMDRNDEPYKTLKNVILEGRLRMYEYEPLLKELRELDHFAERRKVDHPQGGSKDVADGVCGVVCKCIELGSIVPLSDKLTDYLDNMRVAEDDEPNPTDVLLGVKGISKFLDKGRK